MGKLIDITGQTFGDWTVIEKVPLIKSGSNWLCRCKCGKEKIVNGYNLRTGKTCGCGCREGKRLGQSNLIDMTGKTFGEWTVLKLSSKESNSNVKYWTCQCSCGTITDVRGDILRNGSSTSCGCQRDKSHGEQKIVELLNNNNILFNREQKFENCLFKDTNKPARFDFFVNNQYLIEYDGEQHFQNISSGWNIEKVKERDNFKNQWCKDNNIPLIRIPYTHLKDLSLEDLLLETSQFII